MDARPSEIPPDIDASDASCEDINGVPPVDEHGVDLSLIDHCLSLSPGERLRKAQDTANFILSVRKSNGIEGSFWESTDWENTCSTGNSSSVD